MKRHERPFEMQLLPAELWDEIVAAQWSSIVDGTDSSYESLPDVSALACTCWAAHLALRSFMAAKKRWFLELRSRSVQLCARGQLHAAEVRTHSPMTMGSQWLCFTWHCTRLPTQHTQHSPHRHPPTPKIALHPIGNLSSRAQTPNPLPALPTGAHRAASLWMPHPTRRTRAAYNCRNGQSRTT